MPNPRQPRRPAALAAPLLVLLPLLAACAEPPGDVRPPEERHAVQVSRRAFQAEVPLASARDGHLPAVFEEEYRRRGQGPLRLLAPPTAEGYEAARRLARALDKRLIRTTVDTSHALDRTVQATYEAAVAVVPECGEWSDGSTLNPSRVPSRNFGCAYQRNIGLMVADPADLREGAPMPPVQAPRPVDVVQSYRKGEPTATATPATEVLGVSPAAEGR